MKVFQVIYCSIILSLSLVAQPKTDWFNQSFNSGISAGADINKSFELIGEKQLAKVIVAVIDDGVDIYHDDFEGKIWVNQDEIPDNGVDDDANGYIDDVHGWNFLGNPKGENVKYETLELTRLYRQYSKIFADRRRDSLRKEELQDYALYLEYKSVFEQELVFVQDQFSEYAQLASLYKGAISYYLDETGLIKVDPEELKKWNPESIDGQQIKSFLLLAEDEGLSESIEDGAEYFQAQLDYNLNVEFDPRTIVNDADLAVGYGNNMVYAEDPGHGTHVAGIIAAVRDNGIGINGIAPNAVIMPLRAIPAGDERDEDVALAIRYAVDNGARIINMSFGKSYSPDHELVNSALKYAIKNDVLLVHAAGNDASDNDLVMNYPDGTFGKNKSAKTILTVAAFNYSLKSSFLADFSNYGKNSVDFGAPGVDIRSLAPENATKSQSGTSMAAPVVSGVAALLFGIDQNLSAKKVKKILLRTAHQVQTSRETGENSEIGKIRNSSCVSAERAIQFISK
ncbi:MAG: S8 family serine peptidase [Bacteroidota bacterium]